MDELPIQATPLAIFAAIVLGAALVLALRARLAAGSRIAAIRELRRTHGTSDGDVVQVFPEGGGGPLLATLADGAMGVAERGGEAGPRGSLRAIERATLRFDGTGRVGLEVALAGSGSFTAVDLDGIVRLYDRLNEAGIQLQYEIAPGADQRIAMQVQALHEKEQTLLREWLQTDRGEILLDVVSDAAFTGAAPAPGSVAKVRLVVTNVRLALLVQTQTSSQSGNVRRTTTHFRIVGYPLPLVARVVVTRAGGVRHARHRWSFEWKAEGTPQDGEGRPDLLLASTAGSVVFPLAICRVDVEAHDPAPGAAALVGPFVRAGIGFGLLGAALGGIPPWIYWGSGGSAQGWAYDWILTAALCGALAAVAMRCLSAFELWQQRRAASALVGRA